MKSKLFQIGQGLEPAQNKGSTIVIIKLFGDLHSKELEMLENNGKEQTFTATGGWLVSVNCNPFWFRMLLTFFA